MFKTIIKPLGKYKKESLITPAFTAGEVVMEVLIPFICAELIDLGIQQGNMKSIIFYGMVMLVIAFFSLYFGVQAGNYGAKAATGFAGNLRESMYENIQKFSFSNIDKYSTAGLVTRMTTDVTNVQNAYQMLIRVAVRAPLTLISSMVMCFVISPRLSSIFLVAIFVLASALIYIMVHSMKNFDKVFSKYDDLNASVQENVTAIRVVKAFVREHYEVEKFTRASENIYRLFVKAESLLAFNNPVMMLVVYACIIAISWFGAQFVVGGTLTTGELTSMFSYVMSVFMSLMMLSMIFVSLSMSMSSARRIVAVLAEKPDIVNPENPIMTVKDGTIDFSHVSFAYQTGDGENTLSDIELHISAGQTIGVIGGTGSGKSSLVNLISRLYDVSDGCVSVGGVNVKDYDLDTLRNQVSVVLQKNVLFSGTILDNLRWGKEDATLEECQEACRLACADEFIQRFPDGYNTYIEQGGNNVSGGQKQRLCIARALLKKPKVLILDDSTSAVDTATDANIRKAFTTKIPGTTKIIIAQRISSVQEADKILVLEDGRINGFGSHEELLKSNQIYQEIYDTQVNGSGDFDEPGKED